MSFHGVGSLSSPIVISDDEDEAFVEFALEQRISSPTEGMDYDDLDDTYNFWSAKRRLPSPEENERDLDNRSLGVPPNVAEGVSSALQSAPISETSRSDGPPLGQKRKRVSSGWSAQTVQVPPIGHAAGKAPISVAESKNARKKRRKRERLAVEAGQAQQTAGPSTLSPASLPHLAPPNVRKVANPVPSGTRPPFASRLAQPDYLPQLPPLPALPPIPVPTVYLQNAHNPPKPKLSIGSLPPKPEAFQYLSPASPPRATPMSVVGRQPAFDDLATVPFPIPRLNTSATAWPPPTQALTPIQSPILRMPIPTHPPPNGASDSISVSAAVKKPIGMPPDVDPNSQHGVYVVPPSLDYAPNPARSLVMELLPKKFRSVAFIRSWAMAFGSRPIVQPRIELDPKIGKALIEFPSAEVARLAWDSGRLHGEGKEHIRVYWYRVPGVGADAGVGELEEGEIEDGELTKHVAKKTKTKAKEQKKKTKESPNHVPTKAPAFVMNSTYNPMPRDHSQVLPPSISRLHMIGDHPSVLRTSPQLMTHNLSPSSSYKPQASAFAEVPARPSAPLLASTSPHSVQPTIAERLLVPLQVPVGAERSPASLFLDSVAGGQVMHGAQSSSVEPLPAEEPMDLGSDDRFYGAADDLLVGAADGPQPADNASIASSRGVTPAMTEPTDRSAAHTDPEGDAAPSLPVYQPSPLSLAHTNSIAQIGSQSVTGTSLSFSSSPSISVAQSTGDTATLATSSSSPCLPMVGSAPKGPTSVKDALLARQRELETAIARTKELMAARSSVSRSATGTPIAHADTDASRAPSSATSAVPLFAQSAPPSSTPPIEDNPNSTREGHLRRLVLNSKRPKGDTSAQAGPSRPPSSSLEKMAGVKSVNQVPQADHPTGAAMVASFTTMKATTLDLDDLAVSFITETIQTVSGPMNTPDLSLSSSSSTPTLPLRMTEKELLGAKQRLLEQKITESKVFMAQYSAAGTKAQKSQVMQRMEVRMCALDAEMKALDAAGCRPNPPLLKRRWPEPDFTAMVIDISDEESDDE